MVFTVLIPPIRMEIERKRTMSEKQDRRKKFWISDFYDEIHDDFYDDTDSPPRKLNVERKPPKGRDVDEDDDWDDDDKETDLPRFWGPGRRHYPN